MKTLQLSGYSPSTSFSHSNQTTVQCYLTLFIICMHLLQYKYLDCIIYLYVYTINTHLLGLPRGARQLKWSFISLIQKGIHRSHYKIMHRNNIHLNNDMCICCLYLLWGMFFIQAHSCADLVFNLKSLALFFSGRSDENKHSSRNQLERMQTSNASEINKITINKSEKVTINQYKMQICIIYTHSKVNQDLATHSKKIQNS